LILADGKVVVSAKGKYRVLSEEKMIDKAFLQDEWGLEIPGDDPEIVEY
jgi:hypothetical protein